MPSHSRPKKRSKTASGSSYTPSAVNSTLQETQNARVPPVSHNGVPSTTVHSKSKSSKAKVRKENRSNEGDDSNLDSAADTDYDLWEPSASPVETWSDIENENSDGEWPVEMIVNENVNLSGIVSYEVQWQNWHRPDGSSTTWEKEIVGENSLLKNWEKSQKKLREKLAKKTLDVNLSKIYEEGDAHEIRTLEWREAVWEKFGIAEEEMRKNNNGKVDWDGEIKRHKDTINKQIEQTKKDRELLLMRSRGGRGSTIAMAHSRARERALANAIQRQSNQSDNEEDEDEEVDIVRIDSVEGDDDDGRHVSTMLDNNRSRSISLGPVTIIENTSFPDLVDDGGTDELDGWSHIDEDTSYTNIKKEYDDSANLDETEAESITSRSTRTSRRLEIKRQKKNESNEPILGDSVLLSRSIKIDRTRMSYVSIPNQSSSSSSLSIKAEKKKLKKERLNKLRVKRRFQHGSNSIKSESDIRSSALSSSQSVRWTRTNLESLWNKHTSEAKAAPVYIRNDLLGEEDFSGWESFPPVSENFKYLESTFIYAEGVPFPKENFEFLIGCTCVHSCINAEYCDCQASSNVTDKKGHKLIAYDRKGLFLFNNEGSEVIECNSLCKCVPSTCLNRVAQRPRDVAVEVFKTRHLGWGVRTTENLPKGKVLGLYTGEILRREEVEKISYHDKHYIFNLDTRDDESDEVHVRLFSINAEFAGNWTRFINHSCDPVAAVYPVVIDTPLELNVPCLAVVAKRAVPARTEITIDYSPREQPGEPGYINGNNGKGWMRAPIPEGRQKCLCGTDFCRGFF